MVTVKLDKGKFKVPVEKGLKILKKKLMKEGVLKELRDRQSFVSKGRKDYLARSHRKHMFQQQALAEKAASQQI